MPNYIVVEYFRGKAGKARTFETFDEALDYVDRQGEEPGVEWVINHAD